MANVMTGSFAMNLKPFVGKFLDDAAPDSPTVYDKIYEKVQADGRYLTDVQTFGFGRAAVKPENESFATDEMRQLWKKDYEQVVYGLGFNVSWEAARDGKALDLAKKGAQKLRRSMIQTREEVIAADLNNAFATVLGGDGKTLAATDHPLFGYGTQSNMPAVACDASNLAFEQAYIDIKNFKDQRGLKDMVRIKQLIIPVTLGPDVYKMLKSDNQPFELSNTTNAVRGMGIIPNVVESIYLTDTDAWFLQTDKPDGLKYIEDLDISLEDDVQFTTMNATYRALMRFTHGWSDPFCIYASAGA